MTEMMNPTPEPPPPPPMVANVFLPKRGRPKGGQPPETARERLERLKSKAIAALLTEHTLAGVARRCDITTGTLRRWLQDPAFAHELAQAKEAVVSGAVRQVQEGTLSGIEVLKELAEDEDRPDHIRLGAARSLVEFGVRAVTPSEPRPVAPVAPMDPTLLGLAKRAQVWLDARNGARTVPAPPALPWNGANAHGDR